MALEPFRPQRDCEICGAVYAAHKRVRTCSRACGLVLRGRSVAAGWERRRAEGKQSTRYVNSNGYVLVQLPPVEHLRVRNRAYKNGWLLEHRYVMAVHLGRPLKSNETVHHKNGDRQDNRIENLELRVGRHGRGATHAHCATCRCFEFTTERTQTKA